MFSDSHCHLDYLKSDEERIRVINSAKEAKISYMQTISTDINKIDEILRIGTFDDSIMCSVGNHPLYIQDNFHKADHIIEIAKNKKINAIGETGLDYFKNKNQISHQKKSFENHIIAAQETSYPLIVHTRSAHEDTLSILEYHMKIKEFKAVIHCFTEDKKFAEKSIELGFYISASGIVTFKKDSDLQKVFKTLPISRLLLETDSPFLAPHPNRGKENEPAFLPYIAKCISELKGISIDEVAKITTANYLKLFPRV